MYYPSNLTDSQWEIIAEIIEDQRKRKYSLRTIVDAILYLTKSGAQWRMLPNDFPNWQIVYYYFRKWSLEGLTEQLHDRLVEAVRCQQGRSASPTVGLLDSQSVKTASMTQQKGIDGNKKIQGRKRFLLTDTLGLVLALLILPANTGERDGGQQVLQMMRGKYPKMVKILADQGFHGQAFTAKVKMLFGYLLQIVTKLATVSGFQVLPKRWIVERTFGWLSFQRRLVKDYEVVLEHSTSFIHWAMIRLMVRKLAT